MPQNTPQKKGSERRRFYQMGYDEGYKDGEIARMANVDTHEALRKEFFKWFGQQPNQLTVGTEDITNWWLSRFSTHDQEQLKSLIGGIKKKYKISCPPLNIEHSESDKGYNQAIDDVVSLLTSRLSNVTKK